MLHAIPRSEILISVAYILYEYLIFVQVNSYRKKINHAVPIFGNRLQKPKPVNNGTAIHCMSLGSNLPFTSELVTSGQHFLLTRVLSSKVILHACSALCLSCLHDKPRSSLTHQAQSLQTSLPFLQSICTVCVVEQLWQY